LAELLDYTLTVEETNIDVTNHDSSGWDESIIGTRRWTWDASANYLSTGAGQGALRQSLIDADATLYITFQATTSATAKKYQGKTRLISFSQQNNTVNGQVTGTFRGQGNGPITRVA